MLRYSKIGIIFIIIIIYTTYFLNKFIFKGRFPKSYLKRQSFDKALRKYSPFPDIATHTFMRSVLTDMKRKGIPLDHICRISGHSDVKTLEIYLGVSDADLHAAVAAL